VIFSTNRKNKPKFGHWKTKKPYLLAILKKKFSQLAKFLARNKSTENTHIADALTPEQCLGGYHKLPPTPPQSGYQGGSSGSWM
jgi:hypothetical protein